MSTRVACPHRRPYFFEGDDIAPGDADHVQGVTLAQIFLNDLEHIAVMGDSPGSANRASPERFCLSSPAGSPILRRRLGAPQRLFRRAGRPSPARS